MKILFLTPNYKNYTASMYQLNTIEALKKKTEIILWGPGCQDYNCSLSMEELVLKFSLNKYDVLCIGHGWLSDVNLETINLYNNSYKWLKKNNEFKNNFYLELEYCNKYIYDHFPGIKILILNKEYVNLNEKLDFIKKNNFNFVLTHNPHYKLYQSITNKKFYFWPHAVKLIQKYKDNFDDRPIDIFFSGILQNPYMRYKKKNDRRKFIQNKFFVNFEGINLKKKNLHNNKKILWNSYTGNRFIDKFKKIIGQYELYSDNDYFNNYQKSKIVISTLSPADIISPRYFETMISGSICFCEESSLYSDIFKPFEHYIPFKNDLSDFDEMLELIYNDKNLISTIREKSFELVQKQHTYESRADQLLEYINNEKKS